MVDVLYEDNHLLALNKPATIPTMGAQAGQTSLIYIAKEYVRKKYKKPGKVFLGVVSRLDAPVSGVLVFARTSKAAARLTQQFRDREVEKTYWAVVPEGIEPAAGTCEDWLCHNERLRRVVVCSERSSGAALARLSYHTLTRIAGCQLLEINLETGRKHQIRVQLAHREHPILGDMKYGSARTFGNGIALHARSLRLIHPVRKEPLELMAPTPPSWNRFISKDHA